MLKKIFIYMLLASCLAAQSRDRIVASVGKDKIYESEFRERFDFSVHPYLKNKNDRKQAKLEFLKQLIAEKLLANEALAKGYDTLEIFSSIMTPLSNMFFRDALYRREIKERVKVTKAELSEGILRSKKLLKLNFIFSKDPKEINSVYSMLENGASFDSLLSLRSEAKDQAAGREVTFGTMDKEIEDEVYKLKTGSFTRPVQSKDGFYILRLIGIQDNPPAGDPENALADIKKIISLRKEYREFLRFSNEFFGSHKIKADRELFEKLIIIFVPAFNEKYAASAYISAQGKFSLMGGEVTAALSKLPEDLKSKVFIQLPDCTIKIKYFLNQLAQEGLKAEDISELKIRSSLSAYIRKFIQDELLARSAENKGMKDMPDVKKYLGMWRDSYLSKMLMLSIYDSVKVTDREALEIFNRSGQNPFPVEKVNIAEILTDSLAVVEKIFKELSAGRGFQELAERHTKRDSLRSRGGEFGWFPVTKHGELGRIASKMEIGQVYGPVKTEDGYSVFKLLGRHEEKGSTLQNFSDVKDQIIMKASAARFEQYINRFTALLAKKYGVTINEMTLDDIENIFLNLVVVRYMGFGGEIFAVPYTEQFTGWYDELKKTKEIEL